MPKTKKLVLDLDSLLDQAMVLGSSLVYLAKDSSEEIVKALEDHDLLSQDEGRELAEDIKSKFKDRREKLNATVKKRLKKVVDELGIATKEDLRKK